MKSLWLCMCVAVVLHPGLSQTKEDSGDYSGMTDDDQTNSGDELMTPETAGGETSISPSAVVDINVGTVPPFILPIWDPSKDDEIPTQEPAGTQAKVAVNEPGIVATATSSPDSMSEIDFIITPDENSALNLTNMRPMLDDIVKKLIEEFNSSMTETTGSFPPETGLVIGPLDDLDEATTVQPVGTTILSKPMDVNPFLKPDKVVSDNTAFNGTSSTSGAQIEGERPFGQFFCLAQCMSFCISNQITDDPTDCKDFCTQYESINYPCEEKDSLCWKGCNKEWTDLTKAPQNNPTISGSSYIDEAGFQQQYVRIFWPEVPNATLYVIEVIPNPTSMINGAVMTRDVSYDNFYYFLKPNLCYEYYVRVAAVNMYGVSQFGPSSFVQSTPSQLSLNFQVVDMYSPKSFDDLSTVAEVSQNSRRTLVRMTYVEDDTSLNLENFDLRNYLLASECVNDVDATIFEEVPIDSLLGSKVYKVNAVTFAYGEQSLFIILPNSILNANCKYTFRVESVTNTCGKVASFSTPGLYNSEVGTNFRLNCDNVRDSMCSTLQIPVFDVTTLLPPLTEQPSIDEQLNVPEVNVDEQPPIVVPNLPVSIDCQMTGFNVDIVGNVKADKLNVTIWWDAIINDMTKVYFVRHGTAIRPLFVSYGDEISFDYEDPVPVVDDSSNVYTKFMKLPAMDKTALHAFQICVSYNGASLEDFQWEDAPKHIVDFAAAPAATNADSFVNMDGVEIKETNCNGSNKPALSWIVVLASLFVAILCFTLMSIVFLHYTCCRQHKMRKIFVKNVVSPESSNEKPIPIIAA